MDVSTQHSPNDIARALDAILPWVEKPARYTGGEWNSITKDWNSVGTRVALAFPDIYEIGMSNLGIAILYEVLNQQPAVLAERVFAPWTDMEDAMRREGLPLFSLETRHPLREFDIVGFSLAYEQLYTNALNMLHLAGIPLRTSQRGPNDPLIIAGGTASYNPEPIHAFFDAMVIGEGEQAILEIVECYQRWRELAAGECRDSELSGSDRSHPVRSSLLRELACIPGVYVPSLYEARYKSDATVDSVSPLSPGLPMPVVKRIVSPLPPPLVRPIVPFMDVVHNRAAVEIQRGCTRGCRFCLAGMVYRPVRERPLNEVLWAVDELLEHTGFDEVAFLSLSSSDYQHIGELVEQVLAAHRQGVLNIGLPSLRIESFSVELVDRLARGQRRGGFTFAPEAATDRLRGVINKPIASEELRRVASEVYGRGWTTIKLYFMIGHPTQTEEDVAAMVNLAREVREIGRQRVGNRARVRVSVSTFVPKPHTPFQWHPVAEESEIRAQIALLRQGLRRRGLDLSWSDPYETIVEAALSRGDRRLGDVIERAWELGARFDAWQDHFDYGIWRQAFLDCDLDLDWYARRRRAPDETLPWDHVSAGVSKAFLCREAELALTGMTTPYCRDQCHACGILREFGSQRSGANWGCPPHDSGPEAREKEPTGAREPALHADGPNPPASPVQRMRMVFASGEETKYVSHLDLMRSWERALRRTGIHLAYSQGFHPQPRIQFAAPLAVGFSGRSELMDIWLDQAAKPEILLDRVRRQLPVGMRAVAAEEVEMHQPSLPAQVLGAEYRVVVHGEEPAAWWRGRVNTFLAEQHVWMERRRKGKLRKYDLRPLVEELRYQESPSPSGDHVLWMRVQLRGGATGRPDEVLSALGLDHRPRRIERVRLILAAPTSEPRRP